MLKGLAAKSHDIIKFISWKDNWKEVSMDENWERRQHRGYYSGPGDQ